MACRRGSDIVLEIIEKALDEALQWAADDPTSAEAREAVADRQRLRTNLLREFPRPDARDTPLSARLLDPLGDVIPPRSAMH
jgi:hypothetical protein